MSNLKSRIRKEQSWVKLMYIENLESDILSLRVCRFSKAQIRELVEINLKKCLPRK